MTYSISGVILGPVVAGVVITALDRYGAPAGSATSASDGTWSITGLAPGYYTLTPALAGYRFRPGARRCRIVNASLTTKFAAFAACSISGAISGDVLSGVTITALPDRSRDSQHFDANWEPEAGSADYPIYDPPPGTVSGTNGTWTIANVPNGRYVVVPSLRGYVFSAPEVRVQIGGSNLTGAGFAATSLLALAKEQLQISNTRQDALIQLYLSASEEFLARYLQCDFSIREHTEDLDGGQMFLLPRHKPLASVVSIRDVYSGDMPDYYKGRIEGTGRITWVSYVDRPINRWPQGLKRWQTVYTAGLPYMPLAVQLAILQLVARAYERRYGEDASGAKASHIEWGPLLDTDIIKSLQQYSYRRRLDVGPDQDGFGLTRPRTTY